MLDVVFLCNIQGLNGVKCMIILDEKKTDMVYYCPKADITVTVEKGNTFNMDGTENRGTLDLPMTYLKLKK